MGPRIMLDVDIYDVLKDYPYAVDDIPKAWGDELGPVELQSL